jgi:hypothetical protein
MEWMTLLSRYSDGLQAGRSRGIGTSIDGRGEPYFFSTQRPLSLLYNGYPELFSWRVKRPEREADYSPATSAEVRNTSTLYVFMKWCLIKCRDITLRFCLPHHKFYVRINLIDSSACTILPFLLFSFWYPLVYMVCTSRLTNYTNYIAV